MSSAGDNTGISSTGDQARNVQLQAKTSAQGSVFQAAGDLSVHHDSSSLRRPLPRAESVPVPAGMNGLPRRPAAAFVGRDAALTSLRQVLEGKPGTGVISQAVLGLGGVGKSELALQYAHRHRQDYELVWWIDADSPDLIRTGLAALAQALACGIDSVAAEQATVEEAAGWAVGWLAAHPGWLVIFDNVEEVADVEPYLARLAHGHVLITTRRDIGWQHLDITPVRLQLLSRPAATTLLAGLIGPPDAANTGALEDLAEQLGDLPLALTQAGAYIARTPRMTLTRYLDLLKNIPARMYATTTPAGGDTERVVAKVLTLSHTRIQQINPLAIRVLNLLACFAPDNLPCSILDRLPETHPLQVGEALALLASYSLITLTPSPADLQPGEPEDLVSVHRLIQAVTLHQLTPDQHNHSRQAAADLVLAALPSDPDTIDAWPAYRALLPHARTVLPPGSPGLYLLVDYLDASGDYRNALQLQQDICIHAVAALGAEHPDTLTTRHDLAVLTGEAGDAAAARDQHAILLPIEERVLGAEHPHTLTTRHEIASWTGEAGDAAAARDQHAALLPIEERVLGTEHPDTLNTRHDLASWTGEAGDAAAARDQYAALLPIEERVLGAEHPDTLTTRANLARWTGAAGDAAAARDQYAILLPIEERVLGTEHPHTLNTRHDLASWTGEAGDAAAARDQLAALLPIEERVLGAEHPHTLTTRHEIASWTGEAGDAATARDQLAALLPLRERVLGTEHPHTLNTRHDLASWTGEAGDAAAARDQHAALLPIEERVLGAEHPDTLTTRHNLASWTGAAGDAAAARDQYAILLPIRERVLGAEHPHTLTTRHEIASWTGETGDAAAARDQHAILLPTVERVLGTEHPHTLTTRHNLAYWTGEAEGPESGSG